MTGALLAQLPVVAIALFVIFYSRHQRFDKATTVLLLLAVLLCRFHIGSTLWQEFTIDASAHMTYVRFILDHGRLPTPADGMGAAVRHPPVFYLLAAGAIQSAQSLGLANTEEFARYVPMALYTLFLIMGTHLLRTVLLEAYGAYIAALATFLFWPIGITMSGRLTCDILLFAGLAGTFCALVLWLKDRQPKLLCAPFLWAGIASLGKNSGVIMLGFAGIAFLATVYSYRTRLRTLMRLDLICSILFAVACSYIAVRQGWIMKHVDDNMGIHYNWDYLWGMITPFNLFLLLFDTELGLSQESFWNMWLHSLLLGGGIITWKSPLLMITQKIIWCAMLVYGIDGLIRARRQLTFLEKASLLMLAAFIVFMIGSALYLLLRTTNLNYADARYAYPAVIAFALAHGIVAKHHWQAGRMSAYRIGTMLSAAFAGCSTALFIAQNL